MIILNEIPARIIAEFSQKVVNHPEPPKSLTTGLNGALEPKLAEALTLFLEFAQKTQFQKTGMGKNNLYFKNIAIAVYRLGYDKQQAQQIFKNVAMQCKPHKAENMQNWLLWCKAQKHEIKVNFREIKGFYENISE